MTNRILRRTADIGAFRLKAIDVATQPRCENDISRRLRFLLLDQQNQHLILQISDQCPFSTNIFNSVPMVTQSK